MTVPEIGELWSHTADLFIAAIGTVLDRVPPFAQLVERAVERG
ncbi:hypothetical protein GCM10023082_46270 [Streptomyces tremellae]|uniref:Uncharacterized protein n=1 Tax=Streptomyces tremellae TaxID=1124239 RepID=A0ABP7FPM5_9ACTN